MPAPSPSTKPSRSLSNGREAVAYEFFLDEKHEQRLQLQKQPVMTWTNADKYMGAVFVWTYGGRPERACTNRLTTPQSRMFCLLGRIRRAVVRRTHGT